MPVLGWWYAIPAPTRAMLESFGRVLGACLVATYIAVVGTDGVPTADEWRALLAAIPGALALTAVNYFRKGEKNFGKNADPAALQVAHAPVGADIQVIVGKDPEGAPGDH